MLTIDVYELSADDRGSRPNPEVLGFTANLIRNQSAKLRHYHYDVYTFLLNNRDDAIHKGMEGYIVLPLLLLSFVRNSCGEVTSLEWNLQAGACKGPAPDIGEIIGPVKFDRV
jgi:hypothetical protein